MNIETFATKGPSVGNTMSRGRLLEAGSVAVGLRVCFLSEDLPSGSLKSSDSFTVALPGLLAGLFVLKISLGCFVNLEDMTPDWPCPKLNLLFAPEIW